MTWETRKRKLRSDDDDVLDAAPTEVIINKRRKTAPKPKPVKKSKKAVAAAQKPSSSSLTPSAIKSLGRVLRSATAHKINTRSRTKALEQESKPCVTVEPVEAMAVDGGDDQTAPKSTATPPSDALETSNESLDAMEVEESASTAVATSPSATGVADFPSSPVQRPTVGGLTITLTPLVRPKAAQAAQTENVPSVTLASFGAPVASYNTSSSFLPKPPATAYPPPPAPKIPKDLVPPPSSHPVPQRPPPPPPMPADTPRVRDKLVPVWRTACRMRVNIIQCTYPIPVIHAIIDQQANAHFAKTGTRPETSWKVSNAGKGKLVCTGDAGRRLASYTIDPTMSDYEEDEFMEEEYYDFELQSDDEEEPQQVQPQRQQSEVSESDEDDENEEGNSVNPFEGLLNWTATGSFDLGAPYPPPVYAMENSFDILLPASSSEEAPNTYYNSQDAFPSEMQWDANPSNSILPLTPPKLSHIRVNGLANIICDFSCTGDESPDDDQDMEEVDIDATLAQIAAQSQPPQPLYETLGSNEGLQGGDVSVQEMMRRAEEARISALTPLSIDAPVATANPNAIYTPHPAAHLATASNHKPRMKPRPKVRGSQIVPERSAQWYCGGSIPNQGIPSWMATSLVAQEVANMCGFIMPEVPAASPSFDAAYQMGPQDWEALMNSIASIPSPIPSTPSLSGYDSSTPSSPAPSYAEMPTTPVYPSYDPYVQQQQQQGNDGFWMGESVNANMNSPNPSEWILNAVAKGMESTSLMGGDMVYPSESGSGWTAMQ